MTARLVYSEGVHVGYRAWLKQQSAGGAAPLLPFGFGLGYTTFELGTAHAPQSVPAGQTDTIEVRIPARAFEHYDGGWQVEPGSLRLLVGRNVADDFQTLEIEVRYPSTTLEFSSRHRGLDCRLGPTSLQKLRLKVNDGRAGSPSGPSPASL
ncbi:fibronectin type III-like domain-contianing protein [Arthrobacter globiformis]|uniref:fibronectin type III-like domain-contianing protein n=1 Tax=Arthrobacter globiformis TaxID=1665 RepID=UPI002793059A|nr:hypothetical protein [Arthrobacter globiformis]